MEEIFTQRLGEIRRAKNLLEKELKIKLSNRGRLLFVEGTPENEYLTLKILEAINLGFPTETALLLKNEDIILQIVNIRDVTKRKDMTRIKARIIGTEGKTLNCLRKLSDCEICLHDNQVGVIGPSEFIEEGVTAVKLLIQGSKQGNVYSRLEKKKKIRRLSPEENIVNEFKRKSKKFIPEE